MTYFNDLITSFNFPIVKHGKTMVTIVSTITDEIPIVRTTTQNKEPVQRFALVIYRIIDKIKQTLNMPELEFNNGMVEIYDNSYYNMKFHTDQALDIKEDSYILLFSCYEDPNNTHRILRIKNKNSLNITNDIKLENNGFVLFSIATNSKHLHQITLDNKTDKNKLNKWCGVTLRLSKTYIKFINEKAYFTSSPLIGKELRELQLREIKEFF